MEGERVFGASNMSVMIQHDNKLPNSTELLESLWITNPSPSKFCVDSYSSSTSVGEDMKLENQTNINVFPQLEKEETRIDDCEGCFYQPEKKRRLTSDQVHCLERTFEVENKLEPDRKVQLAKELGLQPRQVAIWFQNRRARYKTKQLEKDYGGLKACYDRLKGDYGSLLEEKERLKEEVHLLKEKLFHKEKDIANSESTQPNNPSNTQFKNNILITHPENNRRDASVMCKQEYASSANSDVLDSDQSDGEDVLLAKSLFPTQLFFPKLEGACFDDPTNEGCNGNWSFWTDCQGSWVWPL